jgi:SAM-dependent methyltransferase
MGRLGDESFDAIVCYGGPLSYVLERGADALQECVRVCREGGYILASVMSLWGAAHRYLQGVLEVPPEANRKITDTGELIPENWDGVKHRCHMLRSAELRRMARRSGLAVVAMSASNCLSIGWENLLAEAKQDPQKWQEVLRMELEACKEEGCLDIGTHIILVGKKE